MAHLGDLDMFYCSWFPEYGTDDIQICYPSHAIVFLECKIYKSLCMYVQAMVLLVLQTRPLGLSFLNSQGEILPCNPFLFVSF